MRRLLWNARRIGDAVCVHVGLGMALPATVHGVETRQGSNGIRVRTTRTDELRRPSPLAAYTVPVQTSAASWQCGAP